MHGCPLPAPGAIPPEVRNASALALGGEAAIAQAAALHDRALSRRKGVSARAGLPPQPACARLAEFFHRRRADRLRLLRRLLSGGPRLAESPRRAGAHLRHARERARADPGRRADRRSAMETRLGSRRHRDDRHLRPDPCAGAHVPARVRRRDPARAHRRAGYASGRRDQPRAGRSAGDVGAHRPQLPLRRRRQLADRGRHGIGRRLFAQERHLSRVRGAVHPGAHRTKPDPPRRDRLRAGAQRRGRRAGQELPADLRPRQEPQAVHLRRLRIPVPARGRVDAAGRRRKSRAEQIRLGLAAHVRAHSRAADRGRAALAVGRLSFGAMGTQAAAAARLRAGNSPRIAVRVVPGLSGAADRAAARRHQRGLRDGAHHPGDHRRDDGHRALQSGARSRRHADRHRRLAQHRGERIHLSGIGARGGPAATVLLWAAMPETKPAEYLD